MSETLEDKINSKESKGLIEKSLNLGFNLGAAVATTALSMSFVGTLGVAVGATFGGAMAIGRLLKGNSFYDSFNDGLKAYSAINAVITPIVALGDATYPLIPLETLAGKLTRSIYALTAYNFAFNASYNAAHHLIEHKMNPVGIVNSTFGNIYNECVRIGTVFAPGYLMDALKIVPFGIPPFILNAPFAGFYQGIYPVPVAKKEPLPQMPQATPAPAH